MVPATVEASLQNDFFFPLHFRAIFQAVSHFVFAAAMAAREGKSTFRRKSVSFTCANLQITHTHTHSPETV